MVTLKKEDIRSDVAMAICVLRIKHHVNLDGHENCPYLEKEKQALDGILKLLRRLE